MNDPHHSPYCPGLTLPGAQELHVEFAGRQSIPATPDDVGTPGPGTLVPRRLTGRPINDVSSLLDASLPNPVPLLPVSSQPLQSPIHDDRPLVDLSFAGLPSTNVSLPTPTVLRTAHNLRLPSFDALGIAAPHPDRFPLWSNHSFSSLGAGPLSKPEDPLHALSPPLRLHHQADDPPVSSPKATRQVERIVSTFTPPSEPGTISWGAFVNLTSAGLGSPPSSDPGVTPDLHSTASATLAGQAPIIVPTTVEPSGTVRMAAWVEEIKNTISKPFSYR
jgi:hypothetical protein